MGQLKQRELGLHERGFCTQPDSCFDPPPNAVKWEPVIPNAAGVPTYYLTLDAMRETFANEPMPVHDMAADFETYRRDFSATAAVRADEKVAREAFHRTLAANTLSEPGAMAKLAHEDHAAYERLTKAMLDVEVEARMLEPDAEDDTPTHASAQDALPF